MIACFLIVFLCPAAFPLHAETHMPTLTIGDGQLTVLDARHDGQQAIVIIEARGFWDGEIAEALYAGFDVDCRIIFEGEAWQGTGYGGCQPVDDTLLSISFLRLAQADAGKPLAATLTCFPYNRNELGPFPTATQAITVYPFEKEKQASADVDIALGGMHISRVNIRNIRLIDSFMSIAY